MCCSQTCLVLLSSLYEHLAYCEAGQLRCGSVEGLVAGMAGPGWEMENWSYSGGLPGRSGRVWKLWLGWVSAASLPHCRVQGPLLSQGPRVHLASPAPERERRPCCQLTQRWRWGSLAPINPLGSDEHTVMTATAGGIHSPRLCRRCPRSFAERGSVTCLKWPCVPLLPGRVSEGEALR